MGEKKVGKYLKKKTEIETKTVPYRNNSLAIRN